MTFKCIGATRDDNHREALQAAAKDNKEGKDVPVRLQLEPDNPLDSDAIAFQSHACSQCLEKSGLCCPGGASRSP